MRQLLHKMVLVGAMTMAPALGAQSKPNSAEVLTNQTVVQMVLGKLPKDLVMAKIQATAADFDLSVSGLIGLHTNKVPSDVMKAMMTKAGPKASAEVLTNESVIQLVAAKLPKDVIMAKIQASKRYFDTTTDGLVSLNANKVPKDIIQVMFAGG